MIHNLAQYTATQHQQLAAQQLQNLESQRRTQDLVSTTHGSTLMLHAGLKTLSSSVDTSRRKSLVFLRQRSTPRRSQQITEAEFNKTFADAELLDPIHTNQTISDDITCHTTNNVGDASHPRAINQQEYDNANELNVDQSPLYQPSSSYPLYQNTNRIISRSRIVDQHLRYIRAWLSVVTYQENRHQDFPHFPDLSHKQKQTVLDITMQSRIICARLQFTYGDFQGPNILGASLSLPRTLKNNDQIFDAILSAPLTEFATVFCEGRYRTTDTNEHQETLLSVSSIFHSSYQLPIYHWDCKYYQWC